MITKRLSNSSTDIQAAADLLRDGAVVVFPTDTVYGIGVDPFNEQAIAQLYAAKQRPSDKGLPILLSDVAQLARVAHMPVSAVASTLMQRFWPGPLTLIVQRHPNLPAAIAPGTTIAVRMPDCAVACQLIEAAGGAVATSSANISSQPAAQSAEFAYAMLSGAVAAIIDDGVSPGGAASTIVDCTVSPPRVLRVGPLQAELFVDLEGAQ